MSQYTKVLSMDLAKSQSVWCAYTAPSGEHAFGTVRMESQSIRDLLSSRKPDRLVLEIGSNAGWVTDLANELGIQTQVANTNHDAWRWMNIKRKSDRRDALKLAELSVMNQLPTVHMPTTEVRQWRAAITYRKSLVARRTQIKNSIRAILDRDGRRLSAGKSGWTKRAIADLHALACVDDGAPWRFMLDSELTLLAAVQEQLTAIEKKLDAIASRDGRVAMLRTAPCVGARLAEAIVAFIDAPHRFSRGRDVGCYVGLTPRQYQSGSMDRQGRISGQGNALLRSLLVEVAWLGVGLHKVPWMVDVFHRVCRDSPARKKVAIIAVARRLVIRCWAMLRDGAAWCESPRADLTSTA